MTDINSATVWLPRIESLEVPKTLIIPYDHSMAVSELEEESDGGEIKRLAGIVTRAIIKFCPLPRFVRTDLCSGKHSGPPCYKLNLPEDVIRVLCRTIEDAEMKLWPNATPTAILLREWIDIRHTFTAFSGHPIGAEWRYFANPERVLCKHYYWPEGSILGADKEEWPKLRSSLEDERPPSELDLIAIRAAKAVSDVHDAWSVDFAQDISGKWWLIDMAIAEASFHDYSHAEQDHETQRSEI